MFNYGVVSLIDVVGGVIGVIYILGILILEGLNYYVIFVNINIVVYYGKVKVIK